MANDIKNLLDSIIDDTDKSYPENKEYIGGNASTPNPVTFDKGQFREKLSMFVLKDIISAMMHDETKDLDGMIDESIMKHIHDNYDGTCYGYITGSRDKLKSPMLSDIIQEIDDTVESISEEISLKKDEDVANKVNIKELVKGVENYEDFRQKIKDQVSKQVVDDVAGVIEKGKDAPTFEGIDKKITKSDNNDVTSESVIFRLCGAIVTESAMAGNQMSTEEGLNRAIVGYCISEMDMLFKQNPKVSIYSKYL